MESPGGDVVLARAEPRAAVAPFNELLKRVGDKRRTLAAAA
jgi:hypothetical protein